jgi:hypothetical protein
MSRTDTATRDDTAEQPLPGDHWMRAAQVARKYNIAEGTLAQLRYMGTGPLFSKRGRIVLYRVTDVETWLREGLTRGGTPDDVLERPRGRDKKRSA